MTYRDDHDAAIARADALEVELERAKTERDRAVKERDRLAGQLDAAKPVERQIVVVAKAPLTSTERDHLVDLLAHGRRADRASSWGGAALGGVFGFLGIVGIVIASPQLAVSGIFLALLLGGLSTMALLGTTSDRWQPVLDAVRDDPTEVIAVRRKHRRSGWSLIVETRHGELHMPGDADAFRLLERHCPDAQFDG